MINWPLFKNTAKWLWILAVLLFVIFYAIGKKELVAQAIHSLSNETLLKAAFYIFLAKLCLVANMKVASSHFDIHLRLVDCFRIYNLTQMAKYVPGSIWQFVGRITILRERGISLKKIRDQLIAEHLWIILSAISITLFTSIFAGPEYITEWMRDKRIAVNVSLLLLGLVALVCTIYFAIFASRHILIWLLGLVPPYRVIPILVAVWLFLGASFWVTLEPFATQMPPYSYVIGIYSFAYLIGFLMPFAPAGIGIREAALTLALIPFMSADEAVLLSMINRLLYFLVESFAALLCLKR